jgi:hypothetical protein
MKVWRCFWFLNVVVSPHAVQAFRRIDSLPHHIAVKNCNPLT